MKILIVITAILLSCCCKKGDIPYGAKPKKETVHKYSTGSLVCLKLHPEQEVLIIEHRHSLKYKIKNSDGYTSYLYELELCDCAEKEVSYKVKETVVYTRDTVFIEKEDDDLYSF